MWTNRDSNPSLNHLAHRHYRFKFPKPAISLFSPPLQ
nr:MAG TPA: hypothetical protein [Caudoviricetes sp.]